MKLDSMESAALNCSNIGATCRNANGGAERQSPIKMS
jgi:hypothetical protein